MKIILLGLYLMSLNCTPIVNKLSFFPEKTNRDINQPLPLNVNEKIIKTKDNKYLQCFIVKNAPAKYLLIYFHGNAGNIYQRIPELFQISKSNVEVLGVGYRGYGKSSGHPSEKGIYRDGLAAFQYGIDSLHFPPKNIFIFGRSIGTTAAIDISVKKDLAGVILVTPLTTGKEYGKAHGMGFLSNIAGNAFNNLGKCDSIISPVLILHGTSDEVIPFYMGKRIFEQIQAEKYFVEINGGFHNSLEYDDSILFWGSIDQFIKKISNTEREMNKQ